MYTNRTHLLTTASIPRVSTPPPPPLPPPCLREHRGPEGAAVGVVAAVADVAEGAVSQVDNGVVMGEEDELQGCTAASTVLM